MRSPFNFRHLIFASEQDSGDKNCKEMKTFVLLCFAVLLPVELYVSDMALPYWNCFRNV